ncbi:MAG TPA: acyl-CoA thioesterase II [Polyangiaceae bacterium]|nr:acyl-CoA thioesterase II [Polyangiaceae bacterium]
MSKVLDELVNLLALERIEENLFRGQSQDLGWGTVFGGQVLGQALSAAVQTVPPERHVHSMQAYFLRRGDVSRPIVYDVDRIRDGASFTTRRVVAIQGGEAIFNLAASFQKEEPGFEHQDEMPEAPPPESIPTDRERLAITADNLPPAMAASAPRLRERARRESPFEIRTINPIDDPVKPSRKPPTRLAWIRAADKLPDQPALHRYLLAYVSDNSFITTSLLPHGVAWLTPSMQIASLDHVMWFHRSFRVDEWLLYAMDSPAAHGARGLVRGRIFTRDGHLVANTAQEGLIRLRAPRP